MLEWKRAPPPSPLPPDLNVVAPAPKSGPGTFPSPSAGARGIFEGVSLNRFLTLRTGGGTETAHPCLLVPHEGAVRWCGEVPRISSQNDDAPLEPQIRLRYSKGQLLYHYGVSPVNSLEQEDPMRIVESSGQNESRKKSTLISFKCVLSVAWLLVPLSRGCHRCRFPINPAITVSSAGHAQSASAGRPARLHLQNGRTSTERTLHYLNKKHKGKWDYLFSPSSLPASVWGLARVSSLFLDISFQTFHTLYFLFRLFHSSFKK